MLPSTPEDQAQSSPKLCLLFIGGYSSQTGMAEDIQVEMGNVGTPLQLFQKEHLKHIETHCPYQIDFSTVYFLLYEKDL